MLDWQSFRGEDRYTNCRMNKYRMPIPPERNEMLQPNQLLNLFHYVTMRPAHRAGLEIGPNDIPSVGHDYVEINDCHVRPIPLGLVRAHVNYRHHALKVQRQFFIRHTNCGFRTYALIRCLANERTNWPDGQEA